MTQTIQHTPGPWHIEPLQADLGLSIAICKADRGIIAVIQAPEDDELPEFTREEDEANARVIAAAPELLAALEAQAEAAQAVIDNWAEGDLAAAVRTLDASISPASIAIARAREGVA